MRVTMKKWQQSKSFPALYDVLVNGKTIGGGLTSLGRVLKMGNRYLPILDAPNGWSYGMYERFSRRSDCAKYVAECAREKGLI